MKAMIIGDANVDLTIYLPKQSSSENPLSGKVQPPLLSGGGTAANTAVALAKLNIPSSIIGTIGEDSFGKWTREDMQQDGVDTIHLNSVNEFYTTLVIAVITPNGDRVITVWPPENAAFMQLHPDQVNGIDLSYSTTSWLHTTGIALRFSPIREAVFCAMNNARQNGIPVSLDLNLRLEMWGWDNQFRHTITQAMELADVIFGSGHEEICPLAENADIHSATQALSRNKKVVISRMGANGVLVSKSGCSPNHTPAFSINVVDTLGAGDAFNGGFIAAQLLGKDINDSVRWGNAVASYKIERHGARSLPNRIEAENILSTYKTK